MTSATVFCHFTFPITRSIKIFSLNRYIKLISFRQIDSWIENSCAAAKCNNNKTLVSRLCSFYYYSYNLCAEHKASPCFISIRCHIIWNHSYGWFLANWFFSSFTFLFKLQDWTETAVRFCQNEMKSEYRMR